MPNIIAYLALSLWPLLIIFFLKRFGLHSGLLLSLLGSYMFLPAAFEINFPGFPALDKGSITTLTIIIYLILHGKALGIAVLSKKLKFILFGFLLAPFLTAITNKDPYLFLPGLSLYDGLSQSVGSFLYFFPFLLGVKYFRTYEKQLLVFKYFSLAALLYSLLAVYEIRMSPQLHTQVYGYFPHEWLQQYRQGGFRAVVFMGHGLLVALFLSFGFAFLITISKAKIRILPIKNGLLALFLFIVLLLSKSFAALLFAIFIFIMIMFAGKKIIHKASLAIMLLVITYPLLSVTNLFPHNKIINYAGVMSEQRAQSLEFRFKHEKILLEHASNKPHFGWGTWGRNRVYDSESGQDISVTDGKWIVTFGSRGWFGFLMEFAFIVAAILASYKAKNYVNSSDKKESLFLASHALIVSLIMLDQIPNASLGPLYWFLIGCLLGRSHEILSNKPLIKPE